MSELRPSDELPELLPRLRAVVARVAGTREIDDLVQECCVRFLENEHQFRGGPGALSAWASSIARNLSSSFLARNAHRPEVEMEPDVAVAPELTLDEERVGWILDQLGRLGSEDREVLRLRYFDSLSVESVGDRLGISQAGASKRLARAVSRLEARARRQGWLAAFLPAHLAQGLAGTNPMQMTVATTVAAASLAAGVSFFLPDPETPVQGSTAGMAKTTFAPALDTPLEPTENLLWCGSLQLAWNALVVEAGSDFDSAGLDALSNSIHGDPFDASSLDPTSYVAVAGLSGGDWIETAQAQLQDRFGHGRDPLLDDYAKTGLPLAYAFLAKSLPFEFAFHDQAGSEFQFGAAETDVEAWGLSRYDASSMDHDRIARQATIVHYGGTDDFVIEFAPVGKDRIVVAEIAPGATLGATWNQVKQLRKAYGKLAEDERAKLDWNGGDRLVLPKLDFDLSHAFPNMSSGIDAVPEVACLQTLRVRLDQNGAEVKSRTMILRGAAALEPKLLVADKPHLVAFFEDGATSPYVVLWVGDAELLVPRVQQQ